MPDLRLRRLAQGLRSLLRCLRDRFSGECGRQSERLFWTLTLRPLLALTRPEAERRLLELSQVPLFHPELGPTRFPLAELRRRLAAIDRPLERLIAPDLLRCARNGGEREREGR